MLRRLGLENFKCWRELDIELAPITLLFGANSSGKTAILSSLLMLKQTASGFDPGQHINFGGRERDYVDLGSYRDVVFGHDANDPIGLKIEWDSASGIDWSFSELEGPVKYSRRIEAKEALQYTIKWDCGDSVGIVSLAYAACRHGDWKENIRVERGKDGKTYCVSVFQPPQSRDLEFGALENTPESCFRIPEELLHKAGFPIDVRRFATYYAREFVGLMDCFTHIRPIGENARRFYVWSGGKPKTIDPAGANSIDLLIASAREDNQLLRKVEEQLRALDLVKAFDVKPIDKSQRLYEATATIGGVESSLMDVGFGVSQILPVVTSLISAPKGSIILLEQPELHLHPNAQAALADLMLYAAESRNLQLIVESHSEHIVRRLQRRIAEADSFFATPENIKMYYCQTGSGGSTIDEVDVDRFGQIPNWPERFMGDISGDIHSMAKAAIKRRRQELERVGSGS